MALHDGMEMTEAVDIFTTESLWKISFKEFKRAHCIPQFIIPSSFFQTSSHACAWRSRWCGNTPTIYPCPRSGHSPSGGCSGTHRTGGGAGGVARRLGDHGGPREWEGLLLQSRHPGIQLDCSKRLMNHLKCVGKRSSRNLMYIISNVL